MKDKLRELAERWKFANRGESSYATGISAGLHACDAELLAILDAEGDGGAVGEDAVAEVYEYGRDRNEPVPRLIKGIRFTGTPLPVGTKLYTHPARSGVVIDEEMNRCERLLTACTCHADFKDRDMVDPQCCACELGDEVIDTFRAMRTTIQGERHER